MYLLRKDEIKVSFKYDKIVMIKNNLFAKKRYCDQGHFVLNMYEVMNNKFSSSTYLIDL